MRETDGWTLLVIVGMTVITVVTRCFFFISEREWRLPGWAQRGLQYAPIAALAAVIAPDLVLTDGVIGNLLTDARTWGGLAAAAFYFGAGTGALRWWAPSPSAWRSTCRCAYY
ncbi:AzlD domain-containing protein [Ottowia beijingensis]|uniref:AzlD domain-containing protein n=1 Tax=Ottowia beijingensis TaxID=1207057 RepID=UPI0027D9D5CE|nr:AzlD domain-containing protein [Ottowia beijingensis]